LNKKKLFNLRIIRALARGTLKNREKSIFERKKYINYFSLCYPVWPAIAKYLKFGDVDGPNLCRVKKSMLVPHLLKIYFGLG